MTILVQPGEGRRVPWPPRRNPPVYFPAEPVAVEVDRYITRCLADGDLVQVQEPAAPAAAAPSGSSAAKPATATTSSSAGS